MHLLILPFLLAPPGVVDFLAWAFPGTLTTTTLNATSATVGGVPIGSGLVDTVDVAGLDSRVVALESGSIVGEDAAYRVALYGDGSDGDFTCTSSTHTSGPLVSGVLTRTPYWNNLTVQSGCQIKFGVVATSSSPGDRSYALPVYVRGTLDLSSAPANWLVADAPNGSNGAASSASSTQPTSSPLSPVPQGAAGAAGGGSASGAGSGGTSVTSVQLVETSVIVYAAGGAGGAGSGGAGGSAGPFSGALIPVGHPHSPSVLGMVTGFSTVRPGVGGMGGGGGGGDGATGASGGAGGTAGHVLYLAAYSIVTSGSTAAPGIRAIGGSGGAGGSPASGNKGGGGGGGGGSGGRVLLYTRSVGRTGGAVSDYYDIDGGAGGTGGTKTGTGVNGGNGAGGTGGGVTVCYTDTGVCTTTWQTTGPSGTTGGSTVVAL